MTPEEPKVVTISREALRADLAELELRLRIWIGSELVKKADENELEKLKIEFAEKVAWADGLMPLRDRMIHEHDALLEWMGESQKGHFTEAQDVALTINADKALEEKLKQGWSKRERLIALAGIGMAILVTVANFMERTGLFG